MPRWGADGVYPSGGSGAGTCARASDVGLYAAGAGAGSSSKEGSAAGARAGARWWWRLPAGGTQKRVVQAKQQSQPAHMDGIA